MWYKAESSVRPELEDLTSSAVFNYARQNIAEEERTREDGSTYIVFVYDEIKVHKEDWELFKDSQKQRADIDYLAMMTEVDL